MKIISKWHDYYDPIAHSFPHEDGDVLYKRDDVEIKQDEHPELFNQLHGIFAQGQRKDSFGRTRFFQKPNKFFYKNGTPFYADFISVIFCGVLYRGISFNSISGIFDPPETIWSATIWNSDQVESFIEKRLIPNKKEFGKQVDLDLLFSNLRAFYKDGANVINCTDEQRGFLIEKKLTIVSLKTTWLHSWKFLVKRQDKVLTVSPCLDDLGFASAVDPYTAFQEMNMWMSGTLAFPQNFMLEVDDKYKIENHGFDTKYGFRTRPTKESKKRNRKSK